MEEKESYILLKCIGSMLVKERKDVRMEVLDKVWDSIAKFCATMTVQHYNLKFRMLMENGINSSPADLLAELHLKNLVPNQESYQVMLDLCCEKGDLKGAQIVLEDMKKQGLALTEDVFNSKIKCHLKQNARREAMKVLSTMQEYEITPSCNTYMTFGREFAKQGDIQALDEIIQEAAKCEEYLDAKQLLDLYYLLHMEGHTYGTAKILEYVENMTFSPETGVNCIIKLVVQGKKEAIHSLLPAVDLWSDHFVKQIVKLMLTYEWSFESVVAFLEEFLRKNPKSHVDLLFLSFLYDREKKPENSKKCLELALRNGVQPKAHYYIPILQEFAEKGNIDEMYKTAKIISTFEDRIVVVKILAIEFVDPLCQMGEYEDDILKTLQAYGTINDREMNSLKFLVKVIKGKHKEVKTLVMQRNQHINFKVLLQCVQVAWERCGNVNTVIETLIAAAGILGKPIYKEQFYSEAIHRRLKFCKKEEAEELLLNIIEKDIPIRRRLTYDIRRLQHLGLDKAIIMKIDDMCKRKHIHVNYKVMTLSELKKEMCKGPPHNPELLDALLHLYCDNKDMEKIEEILTLMKSSDCEPGYHSLLKLVIFHLHAGNLERIMEYRNDLLVKCGGGLSKYTSCQICKLQLQKGNFEDAVMSLNQGKVLPKKDNIKVQVISELIALCDEKLKPIHTEQLLQTLINFKYLTQDQCSKLGLCNYS